MEAVIFIGAQATGKSTFYAERFFRTHVRINLDMLRTRHREKRLVETCLAIGQPFVVDNTNPRRADRARYIEPARRHGFRVIGYYFQSRAADAIRRNRQRPAAQQIPIAGIRNALARLERPTMVEGFDALYYVHITEPTGFAVEEWRDAVG